MRSSRSWSQWSSLSPSRPCYSLAAHTRPHRSQEPRKLRRARGEEQGDASGDPEGQSEPSNKRARREARADGRVTNERRVELAVVGPGGEDEEHSGLSAGEGLR